jgi:hypothetical protein
MAKKKKIPAYDWKAFDERTRMIEEFIAKLSRRIEEKQAQQTG